MKLLITVFVALMLWFAEKLVDCKITCRKNNYIIVKNGTEFCFTCNECPVGQGLVPPCGSKVIHPTAIECLSCEAGKTYSDDHDPSSCKNCNLCSAHEIVTKACTHEENTICSNTCEEGFYYENSTHNCQNCSYCCIDDKDIRIEDECKSMPSNKRCSVHDAQRCNKESSTSLGTSSGYPITAIGTTSASIQKKPIGLIVGCSSLGLVIGIIVVGIIIWCRRRRNKDENPVPARRVDDHEANIEDGGTDHLLMDYDGNCDINHISSEIDNKTQNPISEGQTISLSLTGCDNQINRAHTKCTYSFEWQKDGDSIPKNNYHNNSKDLRIDKAEIADSGRYSCKIQCDEHQHIKKRNLIDIRVEPGPGKDWKLFQDLDMDIFEKVERYLTPKNACTGYWMTLGIEYEMEESALKALDKDQSAQVLEYIKTTRPNLTVFEFCEVMKKMKQNKVVQLLKNRLTEPKPNQTSKKDMRNNTDSGTYDPEDQGDPYNPPVCSTGDNNGSSKPTTKPSYLNTPAMTNLCYSGSSREVSREGSVEDINVSFKENVQKGPEIMKSRFPARRKKSGDSQRNSQNNEDEDGQDQNSNKGKRPPFKKQMSRESHRSVEGEEDDGRERKRSRSSSFTNSIKDAFSMLKQPSKDNCLLDDHHEESDESSSYL